MEVDLKLIGSRRPFSRGCSLQLLVTAFQISELSLDADQILFQMSQVFLQPQAFGAGLGQILFNRRIRWRSRNQDLHGRLIARLRPSQMPLHGKRAAIGSPSSNGNGVPGQTPLLGLPQTTLDRIPGSGCDHIHDRTALQGRRRVVTQQPSVGRINVQMDAFSNPGHGIGGMGHEMFQLAAPLRRFLFQDESLLSRLSQRHLPQCNGGQ